MQRVAFLRQSLAIEFGVQKTGRKVTDCASSVKMMGDAMDQLYLDADSHPMPVIPHLQCPRPAYNLSSNGVPQHGMGNSLET